MVDKAPKYTKWKRVTIQIYVCCAHGMSLTYVKSKMVAFFHLWNLGGFSTIDIRKN